MLLNRCIPLAIILIIMNPFLGSSIGLTNSTNNSNKKILTPVDEGPHFHRVLPMREWWYFNVIFDRLDSELRNWSAMISFNYMSKSFDKPDILFVTLYDDENNTYGGMINKKRGALKATGIGLNVTFGDSWAKGSYPSWVLHIEDKEADEVHEIIFDLYFEAECFPYWLGMNTGRNFPKSPLGYYSVISCDVKGNISIDGVNYVIHGTGYHDHAWILYIIGRASYMWDWFSVHFDNGMHAFVWQIIPRSKEVTLWLPGFCWFTDGKNSSNLKFFEMKYLEFENTSIPYLKRPKIFLIKTSTLDTKIDLIFETKNMHEYLWEQSSGFNVGLWEGSCNVKGQIKLDNYFSEVRGFAISEILRYI
ncbi:MAG: hypothetical protein JXA91_05225 [Candidatus Thermoplasmatota archaeon]|nr:hypothetical protein [Candidatus Thermoplasmatota archaeon]